MRIKRIEIDSFGKWQQQTFDLASDVQLFIGANEAGKTTLMAFIHQILFGFPGLNQKEPRYEIPGSAAMGGRLIVDMPNYGEVTIARHVTTTSKKGKLTLTLADGSRLSAPTKRLNEWLRHLNQEEVRALFTFDLDDLSRIQAIDREDIDEYFQSLTTEGSQKIYDKISVLEKEAGKLYKKQGQNPALNEKLAQYEEVQANTQKAAAKNERYLEYSKEHEQLLAELQAVDQKQTELQKELARYEKKAEQAKLLEQKKALLQQKAEIPLAFDEKIYRKWQHDEDELKQLEKSLEHLKGELKNQALQSEKPAAVAMYDAEEATWKQYLSQHQRAKKYAEIIKDLEEKNKQLQEQFDFFAPEKLADPLTPIHEIALPDSMEREELAVLADKKEQTAKMQAKQEHIAQQSQQVQYERELLNEQKKPIAEEISQLKIEQQQTQSLIAYGFLGAGAIGLVLTLIKVASSWLGIIGGIVAVAGLLLLLFKRKQKQQLAEQLQTLNKRYSQMETELAKKMEYLENQKDAVKELQTQIDQLEREREEKFEEKGWQAHWYPQLSLSEKNDNYLKLQKIQYEIVKQSSEIMRYKEKLAALLKPLETVDWDFSEEIMLRFSEVLQILEQVEHYQLVHATALKEEKENRWQFKQLQKDQKHLQSQIKALTASLDISESTTMNDLYEAYLNNEKIDLRIEHLENNLPLAPTIEPNKEKESQQIAASHARLKTLQQKRKELQAAVSDKRSEIQYLIEAGTYEEALQEQSIFEAELADLADEWMATQLAIYLLKETLSQNMATTFKKIQKQINKYFSFLTEDRYVQILWTQEKLEVKTRDQKYKALSQLSRGTFEQLYVAIRLAFIEEVAPYFEFPLIIDDAFVNFDEVRRDRMYQLLKTYSETHQVLYFTFDTNMVNYIPEEKIYKLS